MARKPFGQLTGSQSRGKPQETPTDGEKAVQTFANDPEAALEVQKRWNRVFRVMLDRAISNPSSVPWDADGTLIINLDKGPLTPVFKIKRQEAELFLAWIRLLEDDA